MHYHSKNVCIPMLKKYILHCTQVVNDNIYIFYVNYLCAFFKIPRYCNSFCNIIEIFIEKKLSFFGSPNGTKKMLTKDLELFNCFYSVFKTLMILIRGLDISFKFRFSEIVLLPIVFLHFWNSVYCEKCQLSVVHFSHFYSL